MDSSNYMNFDTENDQVDMSDDGRIEENRSRLQRSVKRRRNAERNALRNVQVDPIVPNPRADLQLNVQRIANNSPGLTDINQIRARFQYITNKDVNHFEDKFQGMMENRVEELIPKETFKGEKLLAFIAMNHESPRKTQLLTYISSPEDEGPAVQNLIRRQPAIVIFESVANENCASVYCKNVKVVSDVDFKAAFLAAYYLHYVYRLKYVFADSKMWKTLDGTLKGM